MGLFDLLIRRGDDEDDDLSQYTGMRMEVMTPDGKLLFAARSNVDLHNTLHLQPITVVRLKGNYIPVTLRGYEESARMAVHMEGTLVANGDIWDVEDVEIMGKENDRSFYRQDTGIDGEVMPMRQAGIRRIPCKILNVSAGGAGLFLPAEYRVGDRFLLQSKALEKWSITPLVCEVRRVTKRKSGYECGCKFLELTPVKEDKIASAIMEMQRQRVKRE